jgi:hypothetical protein
MDRTRGSEALYPAPKVVIVKEHLVDGVPISTISQPTSFDAGYKRKLSGR